MAGQIDYNDSRYKEAADEIRRRHDSNESEANITSAVRDFLILTGLARSEEIVEENPPADDSRRAVDLTALDTFIEVKRRISTVQNGQPNPEYVKQLDDYLAQSSAQGKVRMGVLTDGRRWLLRWPGAGEPSLTRPYFFTLGDDNQWFPLFEWLRDSALVSLHDVTPNRAEIERHFGPGSPSYQRDIDMLKALYQEHSGLVTIRVKRRLWHDLLRTALGELAYSTEGMQHPVYPDTEEMDDLFIRHTYLVAVIGMVVQASFGIDIAHLAENEPSDLLQGRQLLQQTGLQGVLETDFFSWPNEVGGESLLKAIARRLARFKWVETPPDTAAILYETVIPPEERRQLGEYYTPAWLARAMVKEIVTDPLHQRTLDPACGSGTFVAEAVSHFIDAANSTNWEPSEILGRLRGAVTGIDVHPVAVHLARAAWVLAARPAIAAAVEAGFQANLSIPVYLGDALQLRFRTGDMFAESQITIQTGDDENTDLVFPRSLVERAETFDELMSDITASVEAGYDAQLVLDDNGAISPAEHKVMTQTIKVLKRLHDDGRNHIWAYYTRNMVRPVIMSRAKVDVIIGNPPWINYNQTADILRDELRNLSRDRYGIWAGGRYATHQEVASLFFARSVDLYLEQGGVIGFVMPHSALQTGQYSKWRTGKWQSPPRGRGRNRTAGFQLSVQFNHKPAWDLEGLEPNTFFPVPASVVFARSTGQSGVATPLAGTVERWLGKAGSDDMRRASTAITDTSVGGESPYGGHSRQGATIVPRCLFFVEETENTAIIQAGQTITVNPRRGGQDKAPWKDLDLTAITGQTVERAHLFDLHLGETIAPYVTLEPLKALLPFRQEDTVIPTDGGGISLGGLQQRMRERWRTVARIWEENKAPANQLTLLDQMDYMRKLSSQLGWQRDPGGRPVRVAYSTAGQPTAAILGPAHIVTERLYWVTCQTTDEANYLLAVINSDSLAESAKPLMSKGQFGARDLHKHLWKLPIPEFDPSVALHTTIAEAGERAAAGAAARLANLRDGYGDRLTVTIARRELRQWLQASPEGLAVEEAVGELLAG